MTSSPATLTLPAWANGPGAPGSGSGNGGWTAGMLALELPDAHGVAVELRSPPPLGRALRIERSAPAKVALFDDEITDPVLVATARPYDVDVPVPDEVRALSLSAAAAASASFPFRDEHPFPQCIACGIARPDGVPSLNLHCGTVADLHAPDAMGAPSPVFADQWTPSADLSDPRPPRTVSLPARWAALDCPSAAPFADPRASTASVLARIAARWDAEVLVGEQYLVAAWRTAVDGRKQRSVSVVLDAHGMVVGVAEALWIQLRAA